MFRGFSLTCKHLRMGMHAAVSVLAELLTTGNQGMSPAYAPIPIRANCPKQLRRSPR